MSAKMWRGERERDRRREGMGEGGFLREINVSI